METITTEMVLAKETKNKFKYEEVNDGTRPPCVENVYLQKYQTGKTPPKKIKVVITSVD